MAPRGAFRLRRILDGAEPAPHWPEGITLTSLRGEADARTMHALLLSTYGEVNEDIFPCFEDWWQGISRDPEFDPGLVFLAYDEMGGLAGLAHAWTGNYLKDLAVRPDMRRRGLARALLRHVFAVFRAHGAPHIDLKVEADNLPGRRLYGEAGMVDAPWEG